MDNNYNQQTNANLNQQGSPYQQGNFSQQGNPYQQTNPYMDNGYGNYGGPYNYGGNPEPQKAPNIFQQFVLSFVPTQYDKLTKVRTKSMIGFVTLLVLAAGILLFVSVAAIFASIGVEWTNELPDFEIRGGRLYIEEEFLYDDGAIFVYMTDDISEFSYEDASEIAAEGYQNIILVGQDRISVMQNREYQQADFSDFGSSMEINRDWIVDTFVPIIMVVLILICIIFFVGGVLWYFLCAAVYLLFAMLIASIMKKQQPAGALFRVAVYSKVLMFVVATLLNMLPFVVPVVSFLVSFRIRIIITIVFMGFAIVKLPENNWQ